MVAFAYAIGTFSIQRKLSNPKRNREIQRKIKEHTKVLNKMVKEGAAKDVIMKKQGEVMPLMTESMKNQMKSAFVVLPIFFVIYSFALPYVATYLGFASDTTTFLVFSNVTYQSLFFMNVFIVGIIITAFVLYYDRKKSKEETLMEVSNSSV